MNSLGSILNIGAPEMIIIVIVILLLFGGKKIPELMRGIGKGISSFKQGMKEGPDEDKTSEEGKDNSISNDKEEKQRPTDNNAGK